MTAYTILLHELAAHGQTTYKALMRKYSAYSYESWTAAVYKARRLDDAQPARGQNKPIVAVGECPCCGRKLKEGR